MKLLAKILSIVSGKDMPPSPKERVAVVEAKRKAARLELEEAIQDFTRRRAGKTQNAQH